MERSDIPGVDDLFFGELRSFCSCSVTGIKFAIHLSPLGAFSEQPQGFDIGSASVTTMQMSSALSWMLSLELYLLPFRERIGVTQGERLNGVGGAEAPAF